MLKPYSIVRLTYLLLAMLATACACAPKDGNGIYVENAKVYDNRTLQLQLLTLSGRLGQISGVDQNSLISRLGGIQGASSTQFSAALQANGVPMPSLSTTSTSGTPSIAQTIGGTTSSGTPSIVQTLGGTTSTGTQTVSGSSNSSTVSNNTGSSNQTVTTTPSNTNTTSNQTVTTTPSNTVQTVSAAPAVTPAPPPLPSTVSFTLPSTFSVSSLDTLNEEMELSYQLINLQLLLQGALSDDYTPGGWGKRHVTLGFPISISTPPYYSGDVAEVEVSVCNPASTLFDTEPALQTIIPQEKTYNVASLVGTSVQLGAGAVIANVVNVGGTGYWSRQTYYLVKQQDTVALQRGVGSSLQVCPGAPATPDEKPQPPPPQPPVTFAWQFRPVLGQETIQQGLRWTFAQISLAPSASPTDDTLTSQVTISTCWRKYDSKTGIAGEKISGSCNAKTANVEIYFDTTTISGIDETDNRDGSLTAKVIGTFSTGTGVGLGDAVLNDSSPGFENNGKFLRFTAPDQLIAVRGARLLSPDGSDKPIVLESDTSGPSYYNAKTKEVFVPFEFPANGIRPLIDNATPKQFSNDKDGIRIQNLDASDAADLQWRLAFIRQDGSTCGLPGPRPGGRDRTAIVTPYSDSLAEIRVPLWQCIEVGPPGRSSAPLVVLGGKAFGLSDAPFISISDQELTFLAPNALLQGQTTLKLKRLFLGKAYETTYQLPPANTVSVTGISILQSTKTGATFVVTGSGLTKGKFTFPTNLNVTKSRDTYLWFSLKTEDSVGC